VSTHAQNVDSLVLARSIFSALYKRTNKKCLVCHQFVVLVVVVVIVVVIVVVVVAIVVVVVFVVGVVVAVTYSFEFWTI